MCFTCFYLRRSLAATGVVTGEVGVFGGSVTLADRAAWALFEPPINTLTTSTLGVIGPGAYTVAFGGVDANGAETATLAYFFPDNTSWVAQTQTGGAGAVPLARQGAAMAYLRNCSNGTGCFVMYGGEK